MGKLRYKMRMPETVAQSILEDFIKHHVDREKRKKYGLMWNSFKRKPICLPMERIGDIPIPSDDRLFFYDERSRALYATKMADVAAYVLGLEPWEQVDACVFNREMKWVLAVTHEDALLFLEEDGG